MSNRYLTPSPLPFENDAAHNFLAQECAPPDVVQPDSAAHPRLHVDLDVGGPPAHDVAAPVDHDDYSPFGVIARDNYDVAERSVGGTRGADDHRASSVERDHEISRSELLDRDHRDRESCRARREGERAERRARGKSQPPVRARRRSLARSRKLDPHDERADQSDDHLRRPVESRNDSRRDRRRAELPAGDHLHVGRGVTHVAINTGRLRNFAAGPLQGLAMATYFLLLPYVVVTKWNLTPQQGNGDLVRMLLVVLTLFWSVFLVQVTMNVWRLRRGVRPRSGGSAWLAGAVVALLPFLVPPPAGAATHDPVAMVSTHYDAESSVKATAPTPTRMPAPWSVPTMGALPLAMMAKRRSDLLRQHQFTDVDGDVDDSIKLLRALNPALISQVRAMTGELRDGVVVVSELIESTAGTTCSPDPVVACCLGSVDDGTVVGFAREGGHLSILPTWNSHDVINAVVALHDGRLVFAESMSELLRALATRTLRHTLVIYLGSASDLDDDLAACAITLRPYTERARPVTTSWTPIRSLNVCRSSDDDVRVNLLRADPQVTGLCEPLTASLRRRCIEMLAYLALHRNEPVTGDRLRTRVLTHADVDASLRTLANTASVVRRCAGADAQGPRLHAVTSLGLYVTHGITSDVETFTAIIERARSLPNDEAAPLARDALAMVKGEPLVSALRGFEWFLAEGFGARLARDGEWAALALHHDAVAHEQFELAFWALRQGLLIDPYSDVLLETVTKVPRLRKFGGDRSGTSKHDAIGAVGAEAMSWSFNRFSNQVTQ